MIFVAIFMDDIDEVTMGHVSDTFNGLSKDPTIGNVDIHRDKCFTIKFKYTIEPKFVLPILEIFVLSILKSFCLCLSL